MNSARRIFVRAPSWLGDFVMAEPVYAAIDEACDRWTLAGPKRMLELVAGRYPNAERVATDSDEGGVDAWRGHDAALFLNGSFRSLWAAVRAGIPERVSWNSSGRGWLATISPKPAREAGGVAVGCGTRGRFPRRLPRPFGSACIELAGLLGVSVSRREPRVFAREPDLANMRSRLRDAGVDPGAEFCLVNLGGPPGGAKSLSRESWREVLAEGGAAGEARSARDASGSSALRDAVGLPRVLVCGPGEEARVRALADLGFPLVDPVPTLGELLALAQLATHGLTPDSGPRHLAVAAGLPLTVFFGPTDPRHTAEHTAQTQSVRGTAPCAPCHLASCPLEGDSERRCHAVAYGAK